MPDFAAQHFNMVEAQVRANDVTDLPIHRAMLEVPREVFVRPAKQAAAYADRCLEVARGRVLLDLRCFAKLLQAAEIGENETVLDIDCATGYATAVVARLPAAAPYDVIALNGSVDFVPDALSRSFGSTAALCA